MTKFLLASVVLTLIAVAIPVITLLRARDDAAAPISATVLALMIPAVTLTLYMYVTNHGWPEPTAVATQGETPSDMQSAVANLQAKLRDDPDDVDGWILLGNSHIQMQQFDAARDAFNQALELHDDRRARLGLAETTVLQDQDALTGPAGRVFEAVLVDEPLNPKALFYAGMAALAREDNDLVRQRWGRLLDLAPPNNIRQILERQLEMLEPVGTNSSAATMSIAVAIDIAPAVATLVKRGDSLFLVARVPNRRGPPIAAVRLAVQDFPFNTEISDTNAMLPGRSLDDVSELEIVARVSKSGDAISQPGDVLGKAIFRSGGESNHVDVILDRIVE